MIIFKAIKEMQKIHHEIANLELALEIKTDEFQNDLNFALVEIVYEWASAKVLLISVFQIFILFFSRLRI